MSTNVRAQQISLFDHSFYNPTIYNPAFTGNKETTNIMLVSRTQWIGFENAPKLNIFTIDGNLLKRKVGIGALLYNDTKGINKTIGGSLLGSYRINLSTESHLNLGLSFQFLSKSINFSKATVQNTSDPTLFTTEQSQTNFNGNAGLAYFWKGLEIGIALDQILASPSTYFNDAGNNVSYTSTLHYINSVKYTFSINKEKQFLIAPQVLVRYVPNTPLQYEAKTNLYFKNMFWVGAAYKSGYAVGVNAGISLFKKLDIGYSYDIITSDIEVQAGISHELMVNFKFGKRKPKEKIEEDEEVEIPEPIIEEKTDTLKAAKKSDVIILTAPTKEFVHKNKEKAKPGFYVVVGSFKDKEYAKKYTSKIEGKGYKKTDRFYSEKRGYNYVYMFEEVSLEEAMKKIEKARKDGSKDAWIIILTE